MDKLADFINYCAARIAQLRKERDLKKGEIAQLELLEETHTWSYRLAKKRLKEIESELVDITLDYSFSKDLAAAN